MKLHNKKIPSRIILGAQKASRNSGLVIVIYEDRYAESDDQRFNYAPKSGVFILCPHAVILATVIGKFITPALDVPTEEPKTIWNSNGIDEPVLICPPPEVID